MWQNPQFPAQFVWGTHHSLDSLILSFNAFHATDLFWYPLKTSGAIKWYQGVCLLWCFQGVSKKVSGMKWVNGRSSKIHFAPTLVLLYIHDLADHVICNIVIWAADTTLFSKCGCSFMAATWFSLTWT